MIRGGGPQIVTGLKLPFWGLSFVEFWCWGLIFGGQGGARAPRAPPLDPPLKLVPNFIRTIKERWLKTKFIASNIGENKFLENNF